MGITVGTDGIVEVNFRLEQLKEGIDSAVEGLAQAIDNVLMPEIYNRSTTVWNVRTGKYSTGWYRELISDDTVLISNDAEYSSPLEYGWITPTGVMIESEGVVVPALYERGSEMLEEIVSWIRMRAEL